MPWIIKVVVASLSYATTCVKFLFLFFYLFSLFVAKLFTLFFRTKDEKDGFMVYEEDQEDYQEEEDENMEGKVMYIYKPVETHHLVTDTVDSDDDLVLFTKHVHGVEISAAHEHSHSEESVFDEQIETSYMQTSPFEDYLPSFVVDHYDNDVANINHEEIKEHHSTTISNPEEVLDVNEKGVDTNIEMHEEKDVRKQEEVKQETNFAKDNNCVNFQLPTSEIKKLEVSDEEIKDHHSTAVSNLKVRELKEKGVEMNIENHVAEEKNVRKLEDVKEETTFSKDEKFVHFKPPTSGIKKLEISDDDMFSDSYTVGSTSKSSIEWRSSIRDSTTEDFFSSSSRRNCGKWETYTLYQKYEEEMMFLDRISAQKLHETESLRSSQVKLRSISHKIVHKLANNKNKSSDKVNQIIYRELEAVYVAQICLTWEALNWNYANFQRKRASRKGSDSGCPAHIAQQFQHFVVHLQRYIEDEPYEHGFRPEIYARMKSLTPNLLLIPEYQDYEDEPKEEGCKSRIPSEYFHTILEDAIQTYMNFLQADKESRFHIFAPLFRRHGKGSIDPTLIQIMKKINKKKKLKLKKLRRPSNNCLNFTTLPREQRMEILMSLIDLKVVSRVLRMTRLTQEHIRWCEGKMDKIRILEGKLHKDPSPLFFPVH